MIAFTIKYKIFLIAQVKTGLVINFISIYLFFSNQPCGSILIGKQTGCKYLKNEKHLVFKTGCKCLKNEKPFVSKALHLNWIVRSSICYIDFVT